MSFDRESSRDGEMVLRHQPSFSDSGRASVPMWDSSDPDRAPPPLPLNPGTNGPITNKNASPNVSAAAEAIAARARENMFIAQSIQARSPEKSLMKGQFHKRLNSIQPGAVKDLSAYLENSKSSERSRSPEKSPERSPDKSSERNFGLPKRSSVDLDRQSPERALALPNSPTPVSRSTPNEASRPSSRREYKPILGETPPQSATMKALQGTPVIEKADPVSKVATESSALVRAPQNFEAISNQILGLTGIATRLQQEMAALSRRSKDNATDLISLKEATNARDEDIRKALRDLVTNINQDLKQPSKPFAPKEAVSPSISKSISLPRIGSAAGFSSIVDREVTPSPAPYSTDGAAAIALLEKVLREMATKEGQEQMLSCISEIDVKPGTDQSESRLVKQLEEVIGLLKDHALNSRAVVRSFPVAPPMNTEVRPASFGSVPNSPHGGPLAMTSRNITPREPSTAVMGDGSRPAPARPGDFINDEIFKLLKRMKDSIAEGGGMSAEIKALVRELRGEVLGMGREIARKLEQAEKSSDLTTNTPSLGRQEITSIVRDGLGELKEHLDQATRDFRRQSSSSVVSRPPVDNREIHSAVKNALKEFQPPQSGGTGLHREEILEAVREAWETYKPEIEMQSFGLERDEILQCLKEGLKEYRQGNSAQSSASYEEVLEAVRHGLKDFNPPMNTENESALTREEIVTTVRECLESFDMSSVDRDNYRQLDGLREDLLDAVRDCISNNLPSSKEVEFNREDLFAAVQTAFDGAPGIADNMGADVVVKMQNLIENMRDEFQQYSSASGRDTEQVLDAMKDGMEALRSRIETYVDRAADVTGKDEIIDTVRSSLDNLRVDLEASIANSSRGAVPGSNSDLLDAMEREFEHLRSTISLSVKSGTEGSIGGREELLDAIRDGFDELREQTSTRDIAGGMHSEESGNVLEELRHLRTTLATTLTRTGGAMDRDEVLDTIREGMEKAQGGLSKDKDIAESIHSNSGELIEIFNESLDSLKADVERIVNKPIDMTVNYEILDTLKEGLRNLRSDVDSLRTQRPRADTASTKRGGEVIIADDDAAHTHNSNMAKLEVMMTQLKMKVESLDPPHISELPSGTGIDRLEASLKEMQGQLAEVIEASRKQQETLVSKEDTDAIETLLRNTKAMIEEMNLGEEAVRSHHMESLETLIREAKEGVEEITTKQSSETASKTDLALLEVLMKDLQSSMNDVREQSSEGIKGEFESLNTVCKETQELLKTLAPDSEGLASKADLAAMQELLEDFQEMVNSNVRLQAQAFDARKTEHGGLADKIEDVKLFVESIRADLKASLEKNNEDLDGLNVAMTAIGEAVTGGTLLSALTELKDKVETEFTKAQENHETSRNDVEIAHKTLFEKYEDQKSGVVGELTMKIDERFDELMTKYDDAQGQAARKEEMFENKASEQIDVMSRTHAAADDLKILIDTLGTTVTETCERLGDDSKTVYNRINDLGSKMEETVHVLGPESKAEHCLTRIELAKSMLAVETMKSDLSEWNPKMMSAISDILRIVGEHYDQARKSTEEIKSSVDAIPGSIPVPALPAPQESVTAERSLPAMEAYDDAAIHCKLDQLIDHVKSVPDASGHLDIMKGAHDQLNSVVLGLQSFLETQQNAAIESREARSRELDDVAIAIEKRQAQKEAVEADIMRLSDERANLDASVEALKQEQKDLASQKAKMQADVKSLETALHIRREEMNHMEARAETLERRVIEGVLDHSRSLLLSSRPGSSLKSMNLKRVSSSTSSTATVTTGKGSDMGKSLSKTAGSAVSSAVGMALKKRQPPNSASGLSPASRNNRRILSLSAAGGNRTSAADRSLIANNASLMSSKLNSPIGGNALKRSHSVKSNLPTRKSSWSGGKSLGIYGGDIDDKENSLLEEAEEGGSDLGTDRRTSFTGTYTGTEEGYDMESMAGSRARSYTASDAGSEDARAEMTEEEDDNEITVGRLVPLQHPSTEAVVDESGSAVKEIVLFQAPADSTLGTEPPTAALEAPRGLFGEE